MTLSSPKSVCVCLKSFFFSLWCCLKLSRENSRSVSLDLLTDTPGESEFYCGLKTLSCEF